MLQIRSRLDVADNTGARMAKMIGVIGKSTPHAHVGDVITAHVREASSGGTVKKGEVVRAVVVRTVEMELCCRGSGPQTEAGARRASSTVSSRSS